MPAEFQPIYQAALGRLRSDAPPMSSELTRDVLERELDRPAERAFAEFDWTRGGFDRTGTRSAIVRRQARRREDPVPGVAAAIDADLRNGELLATLLGMVVGLSPRRPEVDLRAVAREIGAHILDELDYRLEAISQAHFAERYHGHPFIHVPDVIGELCTERVLTQELVTGSTWSEALVAEQALRDSWAEAIHRFSYGSVNRSLPYNADPHPGNYLFHDDGSVSFLDFGCVSTQQRETAQINNAIVRACIRGDVRTTWQASVEAGLWRGSDPVTPEEVYAFGARRSSSIGAQPFALSPEFMTSWIQRRYSSVGPSANAFARLAAPETDAILGRMDIGVMSVLCDLRANCSWGPIMAECLEGAPAATTMGKAA